MAENDKDIYPKTTIRIFALVDGLNDDYPIGSSLDILFNRAIKMLTKDNALLPVELMIGKSNDPVSILGHYNSCLKSRKNNEKLLLLSVKNLEQEANNNNGSYWYSLTDFLLADLTALSEILLKERKYAKKEK